MVHSKCKPNETKSKENQDFTFFFFAFIIVIDGAENEQQNRISIVYC